uniref:DNA polymerase delta small subunit n=3 Tax=Kalanchoe fedtschenkoi TaxID=63787 RepID=A0A7N0V3T3_KALFE
MDDVEKRFERKKCEYNSMNERFKIHKEMYKGQQYSQIYFARLHLMRSIIYSLIPNWKSHIPVCTVLELEKDKECIVVGTVYKHMKLKPCILDEYSKDRTTAPLVKHQNFMHPDDYLVLEDESGRVKLGGKVMLPSVYVTGVVVAMHGKETSAGEFLVLDVMEAGLPRQIDQSIKSRGEDKYVIFVSGVSVGSSKSDPLQFQLLVDHITGCLGDEQEQRYAADIVHVVIAGNSVEISQDLSNGQAVSPNNQSRLSEPVKELDIFLTEIAASVSLDIMPGPDDPANFALPQQPLHRCLFPSSSSYSTFRSCSNPHSFEIDKIRFIGTSGQNIEDLEKYSDAKDRLEFMERTLRWRHLAPTTPNTLGCYPYTDRDPFIIESCPHVYFAGNQDFYGTRLFTGSEGQQVRVICIPKFCETGLAVVLNLRNLVCHTLNVSMQLNS